MRPIPAFVVSTALIVVVGVLIAVMLPGWASVVLGATAIGVFGAGLLLCARLLRDAPGRGNWWEHMLRSPVAVPRRPEDLDQLERTLGWGAYSGPDFDHRVRPLLGELVAHRLRDRYGIDVVADPERARGVAGAELVALTMSHRAGEPTSTTMRTSDIDRLVAGIEAL